MKLIHLSDLHLGKRVNEFSMIEDQEYILKEILGIIDEEKPDGVLIAGDVYDRSVPSAEAVGLLDDFLFSLASRDIEVFLISGNHDSAERLSFGSRLMEKGGVHIAPAYSGSVTPVTVSDGKTEADIYMLPFVKPAAVRRFFPDEEIASYTDAVRVCVSEMGAGAGDAEEAETGSSADTTAGAAGRTKILVAHQFVTGASRSDSEEVSVGGADNVDASVFGGFDYVALGHIHGPQQIDGRIRYCGTPLKYSFSEAGHEKSVTVIEIGDQITVRTVPLKPKREMTEIRGKYEEVTLRSFYEAKGIADDYIHITLTDEDDIPDAAAKLRTIYPYLMKLDYDNTRTRHISVIEGAEGVDRKTPDRLFADFYEEQNGRPMTEEQAAVIGEMIEKIWEGTE